MHLLILGGTGFLGRHVVEFARRRGHTLTLFNRGKRAPDLFPGVQTVLGDREISLEGLASGYWDAVVDTNGYMPCNARETATYLKPRVKHYTFISTLSVFPFGQGGVKDESSPVDTITPEEIDGRAMEGYGKRKALCEQWITEAFGSNTLIIRPGLIVGPHDPTDRFTYWPLRMWEGGEVLCPGDGSDPIQFIDVRDLAEWTVLAVEKQLTGTFNAVGFPETLSIGQLLTEAQKICNPQAHLRWIPQSFLEVNQVTPWQDMPVWIPRGDFIFANQKARDAGLTFRPLAVTLRDTLQWAQAKGLARPLKSGLNAEREQKVLALWSQQESTVK